MNKLFNFLLIFICLIGAETVSEHGSAEWQKSRMYVHIEESQRDDFLNWIEDNGEIEWNGKTLPWIYRIVVSSENRNYLLDDLNQKSFTRYATIYENTVRKILDTEPNDPYYTEEQFGDGWYVWPHKNHADLSHIGIPSGGDYDMDSPQGWDISTDGSGVIVLIHDQAFRDTHEDFQGNLWNNMAEINGAPGVDDDNNGYVDDEHGYYVNIHGNHGTGVGGAIAARGNNGIGSVGAAWTAQMAHYSEAVWCDGAWQCIGGMSEAIDYANVIGAKIFNASYGGSYCGTGAGVNMACVEAEEAMVDAFNGLFVAAAGNSGWDNDQVWNMPSSARNDHVVAVAALTVDGFNQFNYGATSVDVHGFSDGAIGCGVIPHCPADESGSDDCYEQFGGTSCATPQTAGLLALRWTLCPDDTRLEVKQALMDATESLDSLSGMSVTGGMNNMFNLLNSPCASTASILLTFKGNPPSDVEEGDLSNKDNDVRVYFETNYPESEISYFCQYMMSGFNACNSVDENGSYWESEGLPDGGQSLTVRATHDNGQFVDETITWTVDSSPPNTTITSGPSGITESNNPIFEFENVNSGEPSTFQCRLDSGDWEACTSPKEYTGLTDGVHLFEVSAIDNAGNIDPTPADRNWEIQSDPPETSLDNSTVDVDEYTTDTSVTFEFSNWPDEDEENGSFQCSINFDAWETCESPKVYTGLVADAHNFKVRAVDEFGNADPTPAERSWTIVDVTVWVSLEGANGSSWIERFDINGNKIEATNPTLNKINWTDNNSVKRALGQVEDRVWVWQDGSSERTKRFDFHGSLIDEFFPAVSASFEMRQVEDKIWYLDYESDETQIEKYNLDTSFSESVGPYSGVYTSLIETPSEVWILNNSGIQSKLQRHDIDGSYVDLISEIAEIGGLGIDEMVTTSSEIWLGSGTDGNSWDEILRYSFDGTYLGTINQTNTKLLLVGETIWVAHKDFSTDLVITRYDFNGNLIDDFVLDVDGPSNIWDIELVTRHMPSTVIDSGPDSITNQPDAFFTFSDIETSTNLFRCSIDGSSWDVCDGGSKSYSGLQNGDHVFSVVALSDDYGISDHYIKRWYWTIDSDAPDITINSGPNNPSNETSATFEFETDDPNAVLTCELDGAGQSACNSPFTYNSLQEGSHQFVVYSQDEAGNIGTATHDWEIDLTQPIISVNGPEGKINVSTVSYTFSSNEENSSYECSKDIEPWSSCTSPKEYSELAEGSHTLHFRTIDLAGNASEQVSKTIIVDLTLPVVTIDSGPEGHWPSSTATYEFSVDEASTTECNIDSSEWEICTSPKEYSNLAEGAHLFEVRATDEAGNIGATESRNIIVDTIAPTIDITSGPSDPSNSPEATFEFESNESGSFQCKLDDDEWELCTTPKIYNNLSDGPHVFKVQAIDNAGNMSDDLSWSWSIDQTGPNTVINSGPNNPTNETSAEFVFESDDPNATFECSIDQGNWIPCISGSLFSGLAEGMHNFLVKAVDEIGNEDLTPASWNWTIDQTGPDTTITNDPPDLTNSQWIVFEFESSEPNSTFECSIDEGAWESCTTPHDYNGLSEGWHIFKVRAIAQAGNVDPTPATHDWTVDTVRPETTINDPKPENPTTDITATFHFESSEPNSTFECKLDELSWDPCASPKDYAGLTVGAHTFEVRATDPAGNQDESADSYTWTIETEAADITILSGPAEGEEIHDASASFTFSSSNTNANFECQDSNSADWVSCNGDTPSDGFGSYTTSAMPDGNNNFTVRALINGNVSDSETRNFIVDAVYDISIEHENPIPAITLDFDPSGIQNQPVFRFSYIKTDGPITGQNQLNEITLRASGTGNDRLDIGLVEIWLDMNSDGLPDSESNLGSGEFNADNGSVTITLENEQGITSGTNEIIYLVTYDFAGDLPLVSVPFDIELILALAFMGLVAGKKRKIAGVFAILLFVTSCGGGGGSDGNPSTSHTYNISIQNYSDVVSNESPSVIQLEDTPTTSNYITIIK